MKNVYKMFGIGNNTQMDQTQNKNLLGNKEIIQTVKPQDKPQKDFTKKNLENVNKIREVYLKEQEDERMK